MRATLAISLGLTLSAAGAEDYAVGVGFGASFLRIYRVDASGEITLASQTSETTNGERVRVDPGGRYVVTARGPSDVTVWRIGPGRTLGIASSVEEGPDISISRLDLGLSQDGRVLLAFRNDTGLPQPERWSFRTHLINNRLGVRWSGSAVQIPQIGNAILWSISDRVPYTALVGMGVRDQVAVLSISSTGELADTGQRVATPGLLNVPFDISPDGHRAAA